MNMSRISAATLKGKPKSTQQSISLEALREAMLLQIMRDQECTLSRLKVAIAIGYRINRGTGLAFPGTDDLCKTTCVSRSTVRRATKWRRDGITIAYLAAATARETVRTITPRD
jgi:hypothetical protein